MISVIIPTRNEEELIEKCLLSIKNQTEKAEIIVVDGASQDGTLHIARNYADKTIALDEPNLAKQLNMGAAAATGNFFLFLHADSELGESCLTRLKSTPKEIVGGSFTMIVKGPRLFYKILSFGGNLYCRLTKTHFGDRGIFVRRDAFERMKGYQEMPIMTDVDFSRRMKKIGKTTLVKGPVLTSSRKFDKETPWRTIYLIFYALWAFQTGVSSQKIKETYYGQQ
jgi:rSAM/selenodomain-associated transferase 2